MKRSLTSEGIEHSVNNNAQVQEKASKYAGSAISNDGK
jgi:hypothetical protein